MKRGTLFFVLVAAVACRLPPPGSAPLHGAVAPDFALTGVDGRTYRLADERTRGPVVLVFYRGHW